jgi:hypothetical protein
VSHEAASDRVASEAKRVMRSRPLYTWYPSATPSGADSRTRAQ